MQNKPKMEEHICMEEGISVNLHDMEDVCPNCKSKVISVNDITNDDFEEIIQDKVDRLKEVDVDIDYWLEVIEKINDVMQRNHITD